MTTITSDVARDPSIVNAALCDVVTSGLSGLVDKVRAGAGERELEEGSWEVALEVGRLIMTAGMAEACRRSAEADVERRGLDPGKVRFRMDRDYWTGRMTTFGPILFPLYAYREKRPGGTVTRTPARDEVVPLSGRCRSTPLCLQWECRLGKDHPFRQSQQALDFFTHGAVRQEDTTIAAHMVAVGLAVDRSWLYRPVDEIRRILSERAACDRETGRPVVYASTDAHAERRYVDDTWAAAWKCFNGLRVWTVDRRTGRAIHLGGEFTWGDCREVGLIVDALIADGILPVDGDYGDGVQAELCVITDGLPWIEDHMVARLPWAHAILDLLHALGRLGDFASKCFGAGSKAATAFYRRVAGLLAPKRSAKPARPARRKGHRKNARPDAPTRRSDDYGCLYAALGALYEDEAPRIPSEHLESFEQLLGYYENNAYRGDYHRYHARGFQLGSGAMESLHRTGAQMRLKLAGARWLPETAQAITNLRMLDLVGRWDEFWRQEDLGDVLRGAFDSTRRRTTEAA